MTEAQDILTAIRERYPEVFWQPGAAGGSDILWGRGASGRFRVAVCSRSMPDGTTKLYGELRLERGGVATSTAAYEFNRRGAIRAVDGVLKAYRDGLEAALRALDDYKRGRT